MYIKISSIKIERMNLLSCPYTLGISLSAIKGFIDKINITESTNISFVVIVNQIYDKRRENISRDTKYVTKDKGQLKMAPLLPIKYFDANLDIIIKYEENEESDVSVNLDNLNDEIMISKIQGGNIIDFKLSKFNTMIDAISDSNSLSKIILSRQNLLDDSKNLIEDTAKILYSSNEYNLMSNGYIYLDDYDFKRIISLSDDLSDDLEINSKIVEPNLILVKQISIYDFLKNEEERVNFEFYESNDANHFLLNSK